MRHLIEFVFFHNNNYQIGLFDINDISTIEQINKESCNLIMKDSRVYNLIGTYRALTNRFIYGLAKILNPHEDTILRPSILFFHNSQQIEGSYSYPIYSPLCPKQPYGNQYYYFRL